MSVSHTPTATPSSRANVPRWIGLLLALVAWLVALPLVHGVLPWVISRRTPRHGWTADGPGMWNALGLIPVALGAACLVWVFVVSFSHARELPPRVELNWSPKILLRDGPFALSRNPMYVAELLLWFGWTLWYGSVAVFVGFLILGVLLRVVVPREERDLEAAFGEAYREYKAAVPGWIGTPRRRRMK